MTHHVLTRYVQHQRHHGRSYALRCIQMAMPVRLGRTNCKITFQPKRCQKLRVSSVGTCLTKLRVSFVGTCPAQLRVSSVGKGVPLVAGIVCGTLRLASFVEVAGTVCRNQNLNRRLPMDTKVHETNKNLFFKRHL